MRRGVPITIAALAAFAPLLACGKKAAPAPAEVVPVLAAKVEKREIPLELRAIGNVEALQTVAVKPRVMGEITQVGFREGQDVKPGDLLFTIDPRPYAAALAEAQARVERDRALAKNAEETAARYADLVQKDYVTKEQYEQMRAAAEATRATARADEAAVENARLALSYTRVVAPIAGRTGSVQVHAGNMVRDNDERTLVTINQIQPIAVTFTVPENSLDAIRRGQAESKLSVSAFPSGEPGAAEKAEKGELSFVDNVVDRTTGTVRLKAAFANASGALWPGRFVDVVLTLSRDPNALVIPSEAVQTGQQGSYVFVIKADSTVEARPVTVGRTQGPIAVIAKGLAADERVVTDGQLRLAPGVKVEIKPASEARS